MPYTLPAPNAETVGIPISRPLQNQRKVGSFLPILGVALTTTDTTIPIKLGRQPSGYIVIVVPNGGGVVTAGTKNGADWTTTSITLAASVAGSYSVLVF